MNKLWDLLALKWNKKERILIVSILFAIIVSSAFLGLSILTIPPQPGTSSIALLNQDGRVSPLPTHVIVNESTSYIIEIENHENQIQYFVILMKVGEFNTSWTQGTPAPFSIINRYDKILKDNQKWMQNSQYISNTTQIGIRLIWELWIISPSNGSLDFTGKWVYLPINATIS